jgi:hypothetical protein
VPVEALPVGAEEDGSVEAFADGQVDGPGGAGRQRDGHDLAALAADRQGAMAPLHAQGVDVRSDRLGDPEPIESQQG